MEEDREGGVGTGGVEVAAADGVELACGAAVDEALPLQAQLMEEPRRLAEQVLLVVVLRLQITLCLPIALSGGGQPGRSP